MKAPLSTLLLAAIVLLGAYCGSGTASGPAQTITEFPLPSGSDPNRITAGPDGALWFTEFKSNKIGRITTGWRRSPNIPVPTPPACLKASRRGRMARCGSPNRRQQNRPHHDRGRYHRIRRSHASGGGPYGITAGPDGALWFTELIRPDKIGRITTAGAITEYRRSLRSSADPSTS